MRARAIILRAGAILLVGAAIASALFVMPVHRRTQLPPPDTDIREVAGRLADHVGVLAGRIGTRHVGRPDALEAAARYIEQRFVEHGYEVERQPFDAGGVTVANIEARGGAGTPGYFVIGAHYDSVSSTPGADDNASGVAVLIELARTLAAPGISHSIRFVAFVNEEPPWFQTELMGSLVYAARAKSRGDHVSGMLALETMGYYSDREGSQQYPSPFHLLFPSTGHFLAAVSNVSSLGLLRSFTGHFKAASPLPIIASPAPENIPGVGWSDHWSFWQQRYRALLLTDTAPYRYPHYHAPSDTPDKLDYVRLAWATKGIANAARQLAQ